MVSCLVFLFSAVVLQDLCHKISHGLRRLILHLPGGVGVGSERESGIVVSQHAADGFYVYAVLKCQSCEGVSEVVEADMFQLGIFQDFFMEFHHGVRVVHLPSDRRGEHIRVIRVFVVFLNQQVHRILWNGYLPY